MAEALSVFWDKRLVGRVWLDNKRSFTFQYDPAWISAKEAIPLSLRLPLGPEQFEPDTARPFFTNLLPEADVRSHIARSLGVSEGNDFKLLEALGGDCAGAISLIPAGRSPAVEGRYEPLTYEELDTLIERMERQPLLMARNDLRLSLAGAQEKLPVYLKDGNLFLPRGNFSSSHILKPEIPRFEASVENEAFIMALAGECGLPASKVTIHDGKYRVLLVERYDRKPTAKGNLIRIHQEDFCQALGFGCEQKYETEGGPSLKQCFSLLDEHSAEPIIDKRNLLRWTVFNCLVGNCDAHAKNISLLFTGGSIRLAPFYDLLSTRAYSELSKKMAMRVGGQLRPEWIRKAHWERLADEAGVASRAVISICEEMCETLPDRAKHLARSFIADYGENNHACEKMLNRICKHIESSSRATLERLTKS